MAEPWRYRCPKGHASITHRKQGFECESCGGRYRGDPVDAKEVAEWPADDRDPLWTGVISEQEVLSEVVDQTAPQDRHLASVDQLPWRANRINKQLHSLAKRGLLEQVGEKRKFKWRPTERGRQAVAGLNGMPDAERAQVSVFGLALLFWSVAMLCIAAVAVGVVL